MITAQVYVICSVCGEETDARRAWPLCPDCDDVATGRIPEGDVLAAFWSHHCGEDDCDYCDECDNAEAELLLPTIASWNWRMFAVIWTPEFHRAVGSVRQRRARLEQMRLDWSGRPADDR